MGRMRREYVTWTERKVEVDVNESGRREEMNGEEAGRGMRCELTSALRK